MATVIDTKDFNVPSFLPELIANGSEPNGFSEQSALEEFTYRMGKLQGKLYAHHYSIDVLTEEPELMHCDLDNNVDMCHHIRVTFFKAEPTTAPDGVQTFTSPTFDDVQVGDRAKLRDGRMFIVKAEIPCADDLFEGYVGVIKLDGLEGWSVTQDLRINANTQSNLDIVELTRSPKQKIKSRYVVSINSTPISVYDEKPSLQEVLCTIQVAYGEELEHRHIHQIVEEYNGFTDAGGSIEFYHVFYALDRVDVVTEGAK